MGRDNANATDLGWIHSDFTRSIAVKIFPASNPARRIQFRQIDHKTHQRVHHQNVAEAGDVDKADIVRGFEYAKHKYIEIDPEELKAVRLPTATMMPINQFVKAEELPPALFDRPYFVAPKDEVQAKASASCAKPSRRLIPWV